MTEIIIKGKKDKDPERSRLEEQISFILMKAGVDGPDIDECMGWAFGKDAWYVPPSPDWIDRWNKLHPQAFRAKRKDNFVEFMYVVGFFYCSEKKTHEIKLQSNNISFDIKTRVWHRGV